MTVTATSVGVYNTFDDLMNAADLSNFNAVYVSGYHKADGPGGGLLRKTASTADHDEVMTFVGAGDTRWVRDLDGGTLDAYMAGAYGDGRLTVTSTIEMINSHDDTAAIQRLFK